jgi:DNA-binding CsgD family transcriptional regulator
MYLATSHRSSFVPVPASVPAGHHEITAELAWRALEEIDYGLILVSPEGHVQHTNRLGRQELSRGHFLRCDGDMVCGGTPAGSAEVMRGIRSAARGRRQLLELQHGTDALPVACVPLFRPAEDESASVLLMLARQAGTQNLSVTFFARSHRLTPAEEAVLRALCEGNEVDDIAAANGVCVSTVRTQIRSLRDKTGAPSIRALVQRLASLPPVVPVTLATNGSLAAQSVM